MIRTLHEGDSGPDVALFQRDLNVFLRHWGAPAAELLTADGALGPRTALACRRVRLRLGLLPEHGDAGAVTARERIVIRHAGRLFAAEARGEEYDVPPAARRTKAEVRRGLEARGYETRLRARFKREREAVGAMSAHRRSIVRNQSSRNGVKPRLLVLHTTESHNRPGVDDLDALAAWFDDPRSQCSSHIGNDAEGNDIRMVPDEAKAWTQAAFNSVALSIEQIGHASQDRWPEAQLRNTARWLAHWSGKYGIPLERSTSRGVCQHRDLGQAGGGHHDCGPAYPLGEVLQMARALRRGGRSG